MVVGAASPYIRDVSTAPTFAVRPSCPAATGGPTLDQLKAPAHKSGRARNHGDGGACPRPQWCEKAAYNSMHIRKEMLDAADRVAGGGSDLRLGGQRRQRRRKCISRTSMAPADSQQRRSTASLPRSRRGSACRRCVSTSGERAHLSLTPPRAAIVPIFRRVRFCG